MANYYDRDKNPNGAFGSGAQAAGTMNHAYAHHSSVAEYQASGIPFAHTETVGSADFATAVAAGIGSASSEIADKLILIQFPYVTRWIMVHIHDGNQNTANRKEVRIGFGNNTTSGGVVGENWVTTGMCNQVRLELKTKKLYVWIPANAYGNADTQVEVLAGLTSAKDFPDQNGAYINGITSSDHEGSAGVSQVIFTAGNALTVDGGNTPTP